VIRNRPSQEKLIEIVQSHEMRIRDMHGIAIAVQDMNRGKALIVYTGKALRRYLYGIKRDDGAKHSRNTFREYLFSTRETLGC
jgi:hypothetical protein